MSQSAVEGSSRLPSRLESCRSGHPFCFHMAPDDKVTMGVSRAESGISPLIKPHLKLMNSLCLFKVI